MGGPELQDCDAERRQGVLRVQLKGETCLVWGRKLTNSSWYPKMNSGSNPGGVALCTHSCRPTSNRIDCSLHTCTVSPAPLPPTSRCVRTARCGSDCARLAISLRACMPPGREVVASFMASGSKVVFSTLQVWCNYVVLEGHNRQVLSTPLSVL